MLYLAILAVAFVLIVLLCEAILAFSRFRKKIVIPDVRDVTQELSYFDDKGMTMDIRFENLILKRRVDLILEDLTSIKASLHDLPTIKTAIEQLNQNIKTK